MNERKETVLDRVKAAEALAAAAPPVAPESPAEPVAEDAAPDLEAVAESIGMAPADAQPETPKPARKAKAKAAE